MNDKIETIFIILFIGLVAVYLVHCGLECYDNLVALGALTPLGHRQARGLLFTADLAAPTDPEPLRRGYIRVRGHMCCESSQHDHETLITSVGRFSRPMKRLGPNRFEALMEPSELGYVDIPMWIAIGWGLCNRWGELCWGGTPVELKGGHKITKEYQRQSSNPYPW